MDTVTFIRQSLAQAHDRLSASLEGLASEEAMWRPAPHANAVLEILWHLARSEDLAGRSRTGLGTEVLGRHEWSRRFPQSLSRAPSGDYQFLRSEGVEPPELEDVIAYMDAVHADTIARLNALTADDLDRVPDPSRPDRSLGAVFRHMITHKNNHHGQVDYIRGLMEPGWDLPPGTGVAQE